MPETRGRSPPGISRPRRPVVAAAFALGCLAVTTAGVNGATPGERISFDIPAQSLVSALRAYGERTGVQIMYESHSAAGLQSHAVTGVFSLDEALTLLLTGTGLRVRHARSDAITLMPPGAGGFDMPPADPLLEADLSIGELRIRGEKPAPDPTALQAYSESVQIDIAAALRKDPRTRSGSYRTSLDLWIDSARVIRKARLVHSTGDDARDAAVAGVLLGLTTSRPAPANAPLPIRVSIVVRSP